MSDAWKQFLRRQGAAYGEAGVENFGDPATERRAASAGNVVVDLSHLALIRASGPDTKSFLNGQLTNDVALLDDVHSQLSAWCSAKGRMLAVFRIFRDESAYLLQLPEALRDDIAKRLRMYVLRAKVTVENADSAGIRIGVAGPQAEAGVRAATGLLPDGDNAVARDGPLTVLRLPGFRPRFEILAPPAAAPEIWNGLKRDAAPAGRDAWTWHDIMAGIPTVLPAISDTFVPQMANLDLLGGISFAKGCYTGQEIVARVHYLGRLKQRMYRAHVETEEVPAPGTPIYGAERADQSTGTIVIGCPAPSTGCDVLAVIHTSADAGGLRLGRPDGPALHVEPLPYSVPR